MRTAEYLRRIRSAWVLYSVMLANVIVIVLLDIMIIDPGHLWDIFVEQSFLPGSMPSPWPVIPSPAAIAGCYALSFGKWVPSIDLGGDSIVSVPLRLELTTEPDQERGPGAFILRPAPGVPPSIHVRAYWCITSERTILLVWSEGQKAISAEMGPSEGGLRGRARTYWDFGGRLQVADVSAEPIACRELKKK